MRAGLATGDVVEGAAATGDVVEGAAAMGVIMDDEFPLETVD